MNMPLKNSDADIWIPAENYIPHRNSMRFIDEICAASHGVIARASIRADNPLMTAKGLPAHAGIEYMAQALAGQKGLLNISGIKNGVIVGVKNVSIFQDHFNRDARIEVSVNLIHNEGGYQVAECKVMQGGPIISAEISVMETDHAI